MTSEAELLGMTEDELAAEYQYYDEQYDLLRRIDNENSDDGGNNGKDLLTGEEEKEVNCG